MFLAFIVQIAFRYLLNFPIGWTSELTVITWLWLVLWGAAFVVPEREEIRFDLIYGAVGAARAPRHGDRLRGRAAGALRHVASGGRRLRHLHEGSEHRLSENPLRLCCSRSTSSSSVAIIIRYAWIFWRALKGSAPEAFDPTKASSGV